MPYTTAGTVEFEAVSAGVSEWDLTEAHLHALAARGIDVEQAVQLGWRACAGPGADPWFAFPYFDGDERVGCKRRTIGATKQFTQDTGSRQILYNLDCLRDEGLRGYPIVITEGELDCAAALQCGFRRALSVPGGAPQSDGGGEWGYLVHAEGLLKDEHPVILAVDNDGPGRVLQAGLAKRLGRGRCQTVEYPDGCKDLGDVLLRHGSVGVRGVLRTPRYIPVPGLMRMSQIEEPPKYDAHETLIPGLERHMKIRKGDLIVITGPPGHGKSSFVSNVLCNLAETWSTVSAIASFEQPLVPDLRRILRSFSAECLERDMSAEQKQIADLWIDDRFVFLQASEGEEVTLAWLLERFSVAKQRFKAEIVLIDPWNEISISDKSTDMTTEAWISQSLKAIKQFARALQLTVIIVAHPAKMRRDRFGKVPCPGLWDIADSA